MQCIRVEGLNSMTANDDALIRIEKANCYHHRTNGRPVQLSTFIRSANGFRPPSAPFAVKVSQLRSIGVGRRPLAPMGCATRR